jgi:deazaflavin-dependent oxidoreductase (nitroreductase family)
MGTPKKRRAPRWLKWVNPLNVFLLRKGIGPAPQHVLTIAGRRTGLPRRTPIALITVDGERYAVAGFDGSDWVRNARAAGRGELQRGRSVERIILTEVPVAQRDPILRDFAARVRGGAAFAAGGAEHHPVFRISRDEAG